ncbi:hypothetical protein OMP38_15730 [Cohnella ginsengisoli]|uniref:Uncharacterized protein n=1 Tax=Cohnella ginsengisoli TaxID=425004 RepID=A0A9X4QMV8_9BACL|nr:hypothetical protein [Cohnella ginsengisoli]MDG0792153.1 hypothetical protein [Cohnella ginsengisoli]
MAEVSELNTILSSLSKDVLIQIVREVCEKDRTLKNSLLLKYGKGKTDKQQVQAFKKMIASIVRKYSGRERFIPYRDVYGFAAEMMNLLENIGDRHNRLLELELMSAMLEESMEALQYADDSGGDIGMLIRECMGKITQLADESREDSEMVRLPFFERLLALSESEIFDGWDSNRTEVLEVCVAFADLPGPRDRLKSKLEELLEAGAGDEYKQYDRESLLQLMHRLLLLESEEEAERYAYAHIAYPSFRELIIDQAVESGG